MNVLVDSHCHLEHIRTPVEVALAEAADAGVGIVIDVGMGTVESGRAAGRAAMRPGVVFAGVGIHPNDVREFANDPRATLAELRRLAVLPGVVAIGETGLDFYRDRSPRDEQERSFRAQIALSAELDRTLVIHCRDAHQRVLEILDEGAPERVVMHCFSGDATYARACAERGFWCSFAGNLTYRANDELREAARVLPPNLLLVETDAPYLAPLPHRGKDNVPAFVAITAQALASVREVAIGELADNLHANSRRAFGL